MKINAAPDLRSWLESIGLGAHAERFERDRIDFDVLAELTEADLDRLGLPMGDRKRLLKAIAALTAAAVAPAAPETPIVERRQVTILFADLSGYTQLTSSLGAEATHQLVQRFYQRVRDIVRNHSGTLERHIGDAIMAVFGLPVAHGNDTERALRTALAIHAAMPALSEEVGHPLSVHAGIASGQVVASRATHGGDFSTVGDAVNLAARLVGLAEPGETVLSGPVLQAIADLVEAQSIGEVRVKGFDQPVRAWRMRGWRERRDPGARAPLIGRDAELHQLRELCASAARTNTGRVVLLRGEAGIGKTRLIEELEATATRSGFACHQGLILDFGIRRTRDAGGRIIAGLLDVADADDPQSRAAALEVALARGLVQPDEAAFAHDLLDLPLAAELRPAYDAMDNATRTLQRRQLVVRLVQRASRTQARLLILEDVHWAGRQMLDTLAGVGAGIEGHPVVLLLTSRPPSEALDADWRGRLGPRVQMLTLDLHPLGVGEARELARALGAADEAAVVDCVQRAEGNPLFLEQLLRSAAAGERDSLPGSIHSVVLSRLDRLQAQDRHAIQAASVLGQCFTLPLLRHLIGDESYTCEALAAQNLIRPLEHEYLFAHALVWEGTYASLLGEQRRAWHGAAAQWYAESDPALSAEHLERAQDARAALAYLQAARAETAAHHLERAVDLLERGARLASTPQQRRELLAELGELLPDMGRALDAIAVYRELLELAQDDAQRCRAKIGIAAGLRAADQVEQALVLLDEAQQLTSGAGFGVELARLHYLRGSLFFPMGNVRGCLEQHTLALEHARAAGSIELQLRALSGLGDAHYAAGRLISAYEYFRECVALSRKHGVRPVEAANLPMLAFCAFLLGSVDDCLEHAGAALELAQRLAQRRAEMISHHAFAMVHLERNEPARALTHAQAATDIARATAARRFEQEGLMLVATCRFLLGDVEQARSLLHEALKMSGDSIAYCGPWILVSLARVTADPGERAQLLQQGERILDSGAPAHNHLAFYGQAIDLALQAREFPEALRYAQRLETAFAQEPMPFSRFLAERARALVALGQGERGAALHAQIERLIEQGRSQGLVRNLAALERAALELAAHASGSKARESSGT